MSGWRKLLELRRRGKKRPATIAAKSNRPQLHNYQQEYGWYAREIHRPFRSKLRVYSAISRSFSHTFIRKKTFGRQLAWLIYQLEELFPRFFGRYGQYPVFVISRPEEKR